MLTSRSLTEHVLRGLCGSAAVVASASWADSRPGSALAALTIALIALRGCPLCWTVGLLQMLSAKALGRRSSSSCHDGSCALRVER